MTSVPAYYDSFAGMLPCTAMALEPSGKIRLRINVTRGGYQRGEIVEGVRFWTYPREHFHRSGKGPFHFYLTPYKWADLLA